jgi:hypothetical protein
MAATSRPGDFSGHNDMARNDARPENRAAGDREQKPSKQERQAQKKQAKEEKHNDR